MELVNSALICSEATARTQGIRFRHYRAELLVQVLCHSPECGGGDDEPRGYVKACCDESRQTGTLAADRSSVITAF